MATLLIVDDDPGVRASVRRALEGRGHTVWEARDGDEGLSLARAESPDLVLCDLSLPEREGRATIQELRRLAPAVRLIALSANARLLPAAQVLGADATLSKPVSPDALVLCVEAVLGRPG